jgi:hypothetical protein
LSITLLGNLFPGQIIFMVVKHVCKAIWSARLLLVSACLFGMAISYANLGNASVTHIMYFFLLSVVFNVDPLIWLSIMIE